MENLIKLHKTQSASERTSCRSPLANHVPLVLHFGAYWLMRMRLITIAARILKTASQVRTAFAAAHAEAALFASFARCLQPTGP